MKRKVIIATLLMVIITLLGQVSFAAIEITPTASEGADVMRNTTVSNSFLLCRSMTNQGESLYGATVLPHLVTNADWGAVSYLSNSIYGTNTAGQNTGVEITIGGTKYYSTTGNITGVMNWGSNPYQSYVTQTSGLIEAYINDSSSSTVTENFKELEANKNTRFVETIPTTTGLNEINTAGQALIETRGLFESIGQEDKDITAPGTVRQGLFGFRAGTIGWAQKYWIWSTDGGEHSGTTFRPVIWNK